MDNILDEAAVRHVAQLARLSVTDEECELYAKQLSRILQYVEILSQVDTSNVEPTAHPLPISNVFREDEAKKTFDEQQALHNAPDRKNGCFKLPRVLDRESE